MRFADKLEELGSAIKEVVDFPFVAVGVTAGVLVTVAVGFGVDVGVGFGVEVGVGFGVGVGVGVGIVVAVAVGLGGGGVLVAGGVTVMPGVGSVGAVGPTWYPVFVVGTGVARLATMKIGRVARWFVVISCATIT
jgi:hypothetical protein